ncbi:MAG: AsmA-like C-terminal region-containing protein, partial [Desulfobacteraceae bacterium]
NGAIKGVDLAGMAHNTTTAFGLAEKGKDVPKTEFTELSIPFNITKGLFSTQNTRLKSPVLHLQAKGRANLVDNKLNFRVEPKFVSPLEGQTDSKKRSGILVPVLISGTFDKIKYRPDLKAAIEQNLGVNVEKETEKLKEDATEKLKKEAQKFFKGLPFSK